MSVESANSIQDLVTTNPTMSDPVHEGPQHFAAIKKVLKLMFPGSGGTGFATPITATEAELNRLVGLKAGAQSQFDSLAAASVTSGLTCIYPLGSIYISTTSTNPATLMGFGTWERFGQGRVLVSVLEGDAEFGAPSTPADPIAVQGTYKQGGSKASALPSHTHTASVTVSGTTSDSPHTHTTDAQGSHTHGGITGGMSQIASHSHSLIYLWRNIFAGGGSNKAVVPPSANWSGQEQDDVGTLGTNTNHNHSISADGSHAHNVSGGSHTHSVSGTGSGSTSSAGVDASTGNLPPYIAVYMWRRVG